MNQLVYDVFSYTPLQFWILNRRHLSAHKYEALVHTINKPRLEIWITFFHFCFSESMTSSNKVVLLLITYCVLLSMYSQNVEGQLPGIRWGRGFQEGDGLQRESKGKLWGLMKKRITQHQLPGKILYSPMFMYLFIYLFIHSILHSFIHSFHLFFFFI